MAQTVLITLTTAGADTGPFNLYSNIDGFIVPFETGVSKIDLEGGYTSYLVPDSATTIRVKSTSVLCSNYIDLTIETTSTTTSTSTSTIPDPPTANLTFTSYMAGIFTFTLSDAIYSTDTVISAASVIGSESGACSPTDETDSLGSPINIVAGMTTDSDMGNTPLTCNIVSYARDNSITVNGIPKANGETITIGGTLVTVVISNACQNPYAC